MRLHCNIATEAGIAAPEDAQFQGFYASAFDHVEKVTNRAILRSTWDGYFDQFPCGDGFYIAKGQLRALNGIHWTPNGGTEQLFDPANYLVDSVNDPGRVKLQMYKVWPPDILQSMNGVRVNFEAGWDVGSVPAGIKLAMLLLIGHWWYNREDVVVGTTASKIPTGVMANLRPHILEPVWQESI